MSEIYLSGGDTLQSVDTPNWQGQTFVIQEDFILQFVDLQMRGAMRITKPVIQLFFAEITGEPFGDALSRDRYIVEQKSGVFTTGRVRFSMVPYLLARPARFVLIVSNFPPPGGNPASWQYDKDDATYPRGIRISSNDGGVTWTPHPNDDFMFALFGSPPLISPEPAPPLGNFAAIALEPFNNPTSITFTLETSVPCHLFIHITETPPRKYMTSRVTRGLAVPWHVYYSFVEWSRVEQTEPGDTITHTFETPDWEECQTKWFTFRGKVDNIDSPSVGPIFKHHHTGIEAFCNLGFENYPITPGVPPCWKAGSFGLGVATYERDSVNVQEGFYSCKVTADGLGFIARLEQYKWSTPYRNKSVKFTFNWFGRGRGHIGIGGSSTFFNFGPGWHTWSATITFGAFDTLLYMRMGTGGAGSSFTQLSWDNIKIEIL